MPDYVIRFFHESMPLERYRGIFVVFYFRVSIFLSLQAMGLDISVCTTNPEALYQEDHDYFNGHSLSRTFCHLMLRQHNVAGGEESELDQLGHLVQVNIAPLYAMETYPDEEEVMWRAESAGSEQERQVILTQAAEAKAQLAGNLVTVLATVEALLSRLASIPDLPQRLTSAWGHESYFADFTQDVGQGYIGNNLGQDLRNFQRFLHYAKSRGSTTVYFSLG
jgi:hypothetical protein